MASNHGRSPYPPKDGRSSRWDQPAQRDSRDDRRDSFIRRDSGAYDRDRPPPTGPRSERRHQDGDGRDSNLSAAPQPLKPIPTEHNTRRSNGGGQLSSSSNPGPTPSDYSQDIRTIIDLFSDRGFYYTQHDAAHRKYIERQHEMERCQTSAFSSAIDILEHQTKTALADRTKIAQRLGAADERLVEAMTTFVSKWSATLDGKILAATKGIHGHLTPPPSETSDHPMFDVEEKLAWLRENIEPAVAKRVAEEAQKVQLTIIAGYESRIEQLNRRLDEEKAARTAAEQTLESFATRLQTMENTMDTVTRDAANNSNVLRKQVAGLGTKMLKLEEAGKATNTQLTSQNKEIGNLAKTIKAGNAEVKAVLEKQRDGKDKAAGEHSKTCQSRYESLASTVEELVPLKSRIEGLLSSSQSSSPSDNRVLILINREMSAVEERLKTNLKAIASSLGPLIDKEREQREKLAERLDATATEVAEGAVSISDSIVAIQDLQAHFKDLQVKAFQHNGVTADKLIQHTKKLQDFAKDMNTSTAETQRGLEDLSMQLQSVTSWQNHFTSESLYDSIVAHINEVLVKQYAGEVRALAAKVDAVEMSIDESAKRRKVATGHLGRAPPG